MDYGIWFFILVGFFAQTIDGALGMAYGVISNAILLSIGMPPKESSASLHVAEMATTAVSGVSHLSFGNVNKQLFIRIVLPGVLGGVLGAYLLSDVIDGEVIRPYIAGYLILVGLVILYRAFKTPHPREISHLGFLLPLGFVGGTFDAIGGGGWGPVVTSTLVASGNDPRFTIGSVNASEFFVTVAESLTFFITMGALNWKVIGGLLIGGCIAAPFAAWTTKKLPTKPLMILVGLLITGLNIRTLVMALT